jgi:flagellar biosynthetic protein FliO
VLLVSHPPGLNAQSSTAEPLRVVNPQPSPAAPAPSSAAERLNREDFLSVQVHQADGQDGTQAREPAGIESEPKPDSGRTILRRESPYSLDPEQALESAEAESAGRPVDLRRIERPNGASGSLWSVRDMLPLLAVLALIIGLAVLVKRYLAPKRLLPGTNGLEVIARTPISPKQNLVLVKMGPTLVLLGQTSERITSLAWVEDPDQVAGVMGQVAGHGRDKQDAFGSTMLRERLSYELPDGELPEETTSMVHGQLRGLLGRLKRINKPRNVA